MGSAPSKYDYMITGLDFLHDSPSSIEYFVHNTIDINGMADWLSYPMQMQNAY